MAVRATGAERAEMEFRVCMAGHTLGRKPGKLNGRMAGLANRIDVRAGQREIAESMIEGRITPIGRGVAGRTVRAKAAFMFIVLTVAGIAIGRRALVHAILVAIFARDFGVLSFQFKCCQVVIKRSGFPTIRRVAGSAVCAETGSVGVVATVAGVAVLRSACEVHQAARVQMALYTGHFRVFPH